MAENKEGQEKSEPASQKRLNEARLRGQVAKSHDVTTGAVLLVGGLSVFVFGAPLIDSFQDFMRHLIYNSSSINVNYDNVNHYYFQLIGFIGKILLPLISSIFFIILAAEISQVGFKIASKKFSEGMQWKQVFKPWEGIRRIMFSGRSLFELIKSLCKILLLGLVVYWTLHQRTEEVISIIERPFADIASLMVSISLELVLKVGLVYIVVAVGDFMYQRFRFKEDMKMTKQEVKEESKQTEGDPKIKARLRQIMRSRIRKLMLKNVKKADVVITNPTHFAVALGYKPEQMSAPLVVAKGADYLAAQIKDLAIQNNIPVVEQPPLARTLFYSVEIDQEIPETLFKSVAQVLAYVYQLKNKPRW